jgi:hypothetical protein
VQLKKKNHKRSRTSALIHQRLEQKNANPLVEKTVFETRGVRTFAAEVFKDHRLTVAASLLHHETPFDTYIMFMKEADYWLTKAGENKFLEVDGVAEAAKVDATDDENKRLIDDITFQYWAAQIAERHGHLSPASIAARFQQASDYLHRRLNDDTDLQRAVYAFAQAWHWFHFEANGEHELAARGIRSQQQLAAGTLAAQERAALSDRIIFDAYQAWAAHKSKAERESAKAATADLHAQINGSLEKLGVRPLKRGTLEKKLRELIQSASSS